MARAKKVAAPDGGAVIVGSADELKDIVFCLQAEKKVVVMAAGVFDILHVGQIRCIRDARSRGDYLIVAVYGDDAAKSLKKGKATVIPQDERVEMVASLRWVDYVLRVDDTNCDDVVDTVRPDIFAGGDETVAESAKVEECGGAVAQCGGPKEHSTSKIITRIRRMKR